MNKLPLVGVVLEQQQQQHHEHHEHGVGLKKFEFMEVVYRARAPTDIRKNKLPIRR
jgi:hypothetical protein